jgi:hypothetical protein
VTAGDDASVGDGLTPARLSDACARAGVVGPDLDGPSRYVHLGCGSGATTAAVAAAHPLAQVWAWDWRPARVAATRRRRDAARLANLTVHERPGLPVDLGGDPADIVVVDGVFEAADDHLRDEIAAAITASVRPGGVVCVAYRTVVGWIELTPVLSLARHLARRHTGDPDALVPRVVAMLHQLRAGEAQYLTTRPRVSAWLDELASMDRATVIDEYLTDPFRPLSHTDVVSLLAPTGCRFATRVGDGAGEPDAALPDALHSLVAAAPPGVLRETYLDLALRPTMRVDLFCRDAAPWAVAP